MTRHAKAQPWPVLMALAILTGGAATWIASHSALSEAGVQEPVAVGRQDPQPGALQAAAVTPSTVGEDRAKTAANTRPRTRLDAARPTNPLDGLRAFRYLQEICAIGPRPSGSLGMQKQQELLRAHFEKLGGKVTLQKFHAANPLGGANVPLTNIVVEWHPDRKQRVLLCAHYDTRPLPDRDPNPVAQRSGVFIGANDGASGVAVLMELAHWMPQLESDVGVDFVLFDGEELVYVDPRDPYFLGSTWFARQYVRQPPPCQYRWGVLLDMVGDSNLQLYQEQNSIAWRDTRPLVREIWSTAARLGVAEFIPRAKYEILDDHVPLRNIAKIPTCDIIDYDYGYWHTTMDVPQRCAPASLAKVGWVVYEWLKTQRSRAERPESRTGGP